MNSGKNDAIRKVWESSAPGWAKWEDVLSQNFVQATEIMFECANLSPGMTVIDLASGAGSQTLMAARKVGKDGRVIASDISETMLSHVQKNALNAGLSNISTLNCAAEDLQNTKSSFDAAICRLGLMLLVHHKARSKVSKTR